jgi:hypothetical protein
MILGRKTARLMTSPASLTLCCEWPGLMMPVTEYDHVVEAVPLQTSRPMKLHDFRRI